MSAVFDSLQSALEKRKSISETNAYRLFCGEKEGIPGLVIDRYGTVATIKIREGEFTRDNQISEIAAWLLAPTDCTSVYLKKELKDRRKNVDSHFDPIPLAGSKAPDRIEVIEYGIKYIIRPYDGLHEGLFLDQRENRRFLANDSQNQEVLNLFAYTCSFSVTCAKSGARTTSVDTSKKALDWGKENFVANQIPEETHKFYRWDVLEFLKRAQKKNWKYDLIIMDPPTFSRSKNAKNFSVAKNIKQLLDTAHARLNPKGRLFFSTNWTEWDESNLQGFSHKLKSLKLPAPPTDFSWEKHPLTAYYWS